MESTHAATPPLTGTPEARDVRALVVDDDPMMRAALFRMLSQAGYTVCTATDGDDALHHMEHDPFDVVLVDVAMPKLDGLSLLRRIRERHPELPVMLMAGAPTTDSAMAAVRYRATEYFAKPIAPEQLLGAIARAVTVDKLTEARREIATLQRTGLDARFHRALQALHMAYQPIVSWQRRDVYGYEALVRSGETTLANPGALFDAAEQLGRVCELGRRIRACCTGPLAEAAPATSLFVNLHARDLLDETLYDPSQELARWAPRVVLEITERAAIDDVDDIAERIRRLRAIGFRIAVDDIGAGYSGLNSFATLQPDLVKLDITLVRNVEKDPMRRRLVKLLSELCRDHGIAVVAEGVETQAERDALIELGIDLLQGYFFARPAPPFPAPTFESSP